MKFGLLGEHLEHSYSVPIHKKLHNVDYELYEVSPDHVESFLNTTDADGLNVTIPYKKSVIPFCERISDLARRTGCVNTLRKEADGWHGYNTDYEGFYYMLKQGEINPSAKKILILGNGGASMTARALLKDLCASSITVITRNPSEKQDVLYDRYENIHHHTNAELIINTTPVGMYPDNGNSLIDLRQFHNCTGVADVIYNPLKTALLFQADELGIPGIGGLSMLVAQAKRSAELWLKNDIPDKEIGKVINSIQNDTLNIVLIGMPGCGKTCIGKVLSKITGRPLVDTDEQIKISTGQTIADIITNKGERAFREMETSAIIDAGKRSGHIISTGGGCVLRNENYHPLKQNSIIIWIRRNINLLPKDERPLSRVMSAEEMYSVRKQYYENFSDLVIENDSTPEQAAERILNLTSLV